MKVLIFLVACLSVSIADTNIDLVNYAIKDLVIDLSEENVKDFVVDMEYIRDNPITAIVNEYTDKLLANLPAFAAKNGLDPITLPDIDQKFLTAHITMTNGTLSGVATLHRKGDVVVSYNNETRILDYNIPVELSDIKFTYKYHAIILLIGPKGNVNGTVKNFDMNFKLSFDFIAYHAKLDTFKVTSTGKIDVAFSGNGLVDVIVNILMDFTTTILHPLISTVIQNVVKGVLNSIVDVVNTLIDSILHPANTTKVASLIFN